jgi:hypothetical protein
MTAVKSDTAGKEGPSFQKGEGAATAIVVSSTSPPSTVASTNRSDRRSEQPAPCPGPGPGGRPRLARALRVRPSIETSAPPLAARPVLSALLEKEDTP